jgi:hypothetical protein
VVWWWCGGVGPGVLVGGGGGGRRRRGRQSGNKARAGVVHNAEEWAVDGRAEMLCDGHIPCTRNEHDAREEARQQWISPGENRDAPRSTAPTAAPPPRKQQQQRKPAEEASERRRAANDVLVRWCCRWQVGKRRRAAALKIAGRSAYDVTASGGWLVVWRGVVRDPDKMRIPTMR